MIYGHARRFFHFHEYLRFLVALLFSAAGIDRGAMFSLLISGFVAQGSHPASHQRLFFPSFFGNMTDPLAGRQFFPVVIE